MKWLLEGFDTERICVTNGSRVQAQVRYTAILDFRERAEEV